MGAYVTMAGLRTVRREKERRMSETGRQGTDNIGFATLSSLAWVVVGLCMAVGAAPPAWGQCAGEHKLTASDAAADDFFGGSVSVSGDTAVVGAHADDDGGFASGAAYVYTRPGGVWMQQQKLTASDAAAGDLFGDSVSVSGDTVLVGAYGNDDAGADSGSAYVFVRSGGAWTQQLKLTASDAEASNFFGFSVSVSGDTAVVAAPFNSDAANGSGSAYVFVRSGTAWTQQQKLTASDAAEKDYFGWSVSVDGDMIVVGARGDSDAGQDSGSAYVFVRAGAVWTQHQKLTASDAAGGDVFGRSVSISGNTVVVGADQNDDAGFQSGSAYVYVRSGGLWTQQQKLTASDAAAGDGFGHSVSASGDTTVAGAPGRDDTGIDFGSAYVYVRSEGVWTQQQTLTASDASAGDNFGYSVSLNGNTSVIGAFQDDDAGADSGSAYVFGVNCNGACCLNGACDLLKQSTCATFGGVFFGPDSACDSVTCPSICGADLIPCPAGDGMVDIFDILGVLDAFSGADCCAP